MTSVGRPVQVKDGLRYVAGPGRRLLSGPFRRPEASWLELAPVITQRRAQMVRVCQRLGDIADVLLGLISWGPVPPDVPDEREIVLPDAVLNDRQHLEVPEVEALLDLRIGRQVLAEDLERRNVHDHGPAP